MITKCRVRQDTDLPFRWDDNRSVMVNRCPTGHHTRGKSITRDTCALCAAVSRATSKSMSYGHLRPDESQSPTTRAPDGTRAPDVRQDGPGWRVGGGCPQGVPGWDAGGGCPTGRGPDGIRVAGVRQDTDLIVAPDTVAQSAQVSGGKMITKCRVRQDTDLPLRRDDNQA